jgi:hypothetical protein
VNDTAYAEFVTVGEFRQFEKRMDEKLDGLIDQVTVIGESQVARAWLGPRGTRMAGHAWALLVAVLAAGVAAVVTVILSN